MGRPGALISGTCPVCGSNGEFVLVGPNVREQLVCQRCGSTSRQRHVAVELLRAVGDSAASLAQLASSNQVLSLYSAAGSGPLFERLRGKAGCVFSDLLEDVPAGSVIADGLRCEDLQALTFDGASFDVVVTEDVLEHVRDYAAALREIRRVLRPGGVHLFTVPMYFDRPTIRRVDTSGAEDVHLLEPEYHGDPVRGQILAYRTFGIDLFGELTALGFETTLSASTLELAQFGIYNSQVLVSRKV